MDRLKFKTAKEYDENATRDELLAEVSERQKAGSPNFSEIKSNTSKADVVAMLVLDDEHADAKADETPEAKSAGKAVKIPRVTKQELAVVEAHNPPTDDMFTSYARRESNGQVYAVAVHEPNTYGRTHTCKNSDGVCEFTKKDFREQFEKCDAPKEVVE